MVGRHLGVEYYYQQKEGHPLTVEEKSICLYINLAATSDAKRLVFNSIYHQIPENILNLGMVRNIINNQ